jgi:Flp pilus assembly protein CpaB
MKTGITVPSLLLVVAALVLLPGYFRHRASRLAAENAARSLPPFTLPGSIPPGMVAVSVTAKEMIATTGFFTTGARVDVLLRNGESQITKVLDNVEVIALGMHSELSPPAAVVTLMVTKAEADKLTKAASQESIVLKLRNPAEILPNQ